MFEKNQSFNHIALVVCGILKKGREQITQPIRTHNTAFQHQLWTIWTVWVSAFQTVRRVNNASFPEQFWSRTKEIVLSARALMHEERPWTWERKAVFLLLPWHSRWRLSLIWHSWPSHIITTVLEIYLTAVLKPSSAETSMILHLGTLSAWQWMDKELADIDVFLQRSAFTRALTFLKMLVQ